MPQTAAQTPDKPPTHVWLDILHFSQGVDEAFDEATEACAQARAALEQYIKTLRKSLGGSKDIAYVSVNKDSHLVEVPEGLAKNVPGNFVRAGNRKNFVRCGLVQHPTWCCLRVMNK